MGRVKKIKTKKNAKGPIRRKSFKGSDGTIQSPEIASGMTGGESEVSGGRGGFFLFLSIWASFCLVTLTFSNFSWMIPSVAKKIPFQQSYGVSFFLFAAMIVAVRFLPAGNTDKNWTSWTGRFWLLISLGLGSFLCFYQADLPMANYSIDTAFNIAHIRHIVDLKNYQGTLTPTYGIWPLWEVTAIALWHLLPDASSLLIQRLANGALDLGAIWILYLAGKEVGGRRMGIFAAALAAVSKPLVIKVVAGFGYSAMTFGMSLALLFTLRLFEKKRISDYLKWGASVGFLAYTCTPFQPFIPFFVLIVFGFLWIRKNIGRPGLMVWATFLVLLIYFLYCNNAFSAGSWVDRLVAWVGPSGARWVIWVFLSGVLWVVAKTHLEGTETAWAGWMAGAWLCAFLSFPFLANREFLNIIRNHALVSGSGFLSWPYLSQSFHQVGQTLQTLFWIGGDRSDMALEADSYFSYPEVILIAAGLAFALGKPNLKIIFLVLAAAAGTAPHFFSSETHSGRLIACPPAFLLVAAFGLSEVMKMLSPSTRIKSLLMSLLLVCFWGWAGNGIYDRIYRQWAQKPVGHVAVRNQAFQDLERGYEVYLPSSLADGDLGVLYEGHSVHLLRDTNLVAVGSDEKPVDRVVLVGMGSVEQQKLEKNFPKAAWSIVKILGRGPGVFAAAARCQISFEDLADPRQKMFIVRRVVPPYWRRTITNSNSGLGFGFLSWDDKTANVNDPVPPVVYLDYAGVRYQGVIHVERGGEYQIHCKAINRTEVLVDGQKVLNFYFYRTDTTMAPGVDVKKSINLGPGDHRVEVTTCYQRSFTPPEISLFPKESPGMERSLWNSFSF